MTVLSLLAGATTHAAASVVAQVAGGASCRLAYSAGTTLAGSPNYTTARSADADGYVRFDLTGLTADQAYTYAVEEASVLDVRRGHFRTHPAAAGTPCNFNLIHSSCSPGSGQPTSSHPVFDTIRLHDPLMFLHQGDIHYANLVNPTTAQAQAAFRGAITDTTRARALYEAVALAFEPDDHDTPGGDNTDRTSLGWPVHAAVYRQQFPSYPLPSLGDGATYHAWVIGRVRFIQTDLRTHRDPNNTPDGPTKTMLGATQKAWFFDQLLAAKAAGHLAVWLNTQVWNVDPPYSTYDNDLDHWGAFADERTEIDNYRSEHGIRDLVILCGDMHSLGMKLGVDYSDDQDVPADVFVASALDSSPFVRGNDWDGIKSGSGHYGRLVVADDGSRLTLTWEGRGVESSGSNDRVHMSHTRTYLGPPPGLYALRDSNGDRRWFRDGDDERRYARVT